MIQHLLIDLDDTLLVNNMDTFAPAYYKALSSYMAVLVPPDRLLAELMKGTFAMIQNNDPASTLEQVFDAVFYPGLGCSKQDLFSRLNDFYEFEFPKLQPLTSPIPVAITLIHDVLKQGTKVTVATNPLFPLTAIKQRLVWAGLDPNVVPFTHIPSYESSHFAKPNPNYYVELVSILKTEPGSCVMVGNDLQADILPALNAGLHAFHVIEATSEISRPLDGYMEGSISAARKILTEQHI